MAERQRIHLVDGSGYIFRAYYAIRSLSTSTGVPTNAVTGFARMLNKLLKDEQPDLLGIAFDTREKNFRHEIYEDYKANRDQPPEDLIPQFGLIHSLVEAMDIPLLREPGFEADDVIATLSNTAVERGYDVVIVTGDKDLMQLVCPRVSIFDPMKDRYIRREHVEERFGVPPEKVLDVIALAGDPSDNIPGVPKVGPKSAAKLVLEYGSLEEVLAALPHKKKLKAYERAVIEHQEQARLSKRLAALSYEVPIEIDFGALKYEAAQPAKLAPFLRSIEAFGLLRDFGLEREEASAQVVVATGSTRVAVEEAPLPVIDRSEYRTIASLEALDELLQTARQCKKLAVDTETTSLDPNRANIVGIALCVPGRPASYVPLAHRYLGAPKQLDRQAVLERLRPILEDHEIAKAGQNLKYDWVVLSRAGLRMGGLAHDSMLAAHVLDPARSSYSLDSLAREILGHETIRYSDVAGSGRTQRSFDEVPIDAATEYSAEDADVALKLCEFLEDRIERAELEHLYREIELPLSPVLASMEHHGVLVDASALHKLSQEFGERLRAIEARAADLVGCKINLASPKQLAALFFEKLQYPVVKKTRTGYSTDQEVLEVLARDYELPRIVLEHRMLSKLRSTYVDALPKMINPHSGRVHTCFNQSGTATGRLSSSNPNLQNIPIRSDDGRRIREAFIADPGCVLISADYSQIELRIMAHLSEDPAFVEAFQRGEDIHSRTAREVIAADGEPNPEQRRQAKAINFGILYGLSEFGLSKQLGMPRAEASSFISAYFGRYPRIRLFLDETIDQARQDGFVTTISGRRRFLPDINSRNRNARQAAERIAMNTPIQGSAADLIKLAMLKVAAAIEQRRLETRLLLQVHDELVLEAPSREREEVEELLREQMTSVMELAVPLTVDVGWGDSWAAAH